MTSPSKLARVREKMLLPRLEEIERAFTSTYWELVYLEGAPMPSTLSGALAERLAHVDPSTWQARIAAGGIFVNGAEALNDLSLPSPCRIEYYEPKFDYAHPEEFFPPFEQRQILYRDPHLVAVFKPPRLPSMPGREQKRFTLKSYLEQYLGHPVHMPSRLDTSTAGVVVVSTDPECHHRLQRQFEGRRIGKRYLLESAPGVPWSEREVDAAIGKDPSHPVLRKVVECGGKPAITRFTKLAEGTHRDQQGVQHQSAYLLAEPFTGRTHQIRVHAHTFRFPIIGDRFYGGVSASTLRLLSFQISLLHPKHLTPLTIRVPEELLPEWAMPVAKELDRLSAHSIPEKG